MYSKSYGNTYGKFDWVVSASQYLVTTQVAEETLERTCSNSLTLDTSLSATLSTLHNIDFSNILEVTQSLLCEVETPVVIPQEDNSAEYGDLDPYGSTEPFGYSPSLDANLQTAYYGVLNVDGYGFSFVPNPGAYHSARNWLRVRQEGEGSLTPDFCEILYLEGTDTPKYLRDVKQKKLTLLQYAVGVNTSVKNKLFLSQEVIGSPYREVTSRLRFGAYGTNGSLTEAAQKAESNMKFGAAENATNLADSPGLLLTQEATNNFKVFRAGNTLEVSQNAFIVGVTSNRLEMWQRATFGDKDVAVAVNELDGFIQSWELWRFRNTKKIANRLVPLQTATRIFKVEIFLPVKDTSLVLKSESISRVFTSLIKLKQSLLVSYEANQQVVPPKYVNANTLTTISNSASARLLKIERLKSSLIFSQEVGTELNSIKTVNTGNILSISTDTWSRNLSPIKVESILVTNQSSQNVKESVKYLSGRSQLLSSSQQDLLFSERPAAAGLGIGQTVECLVIKNANKGDSTYSRLGFSQSATYATVVDGVTVHSAETSNSLGINHGYVRTIDASNSLTIETQASKVTSSTSSLGIGQQVSREFLANIKDVLAIDDVANTNNVSIQYVKQSLSISQPGYVTKNGRPISLARRKTTILRV